MTAKEQVQIAELKTELRASIKQVLASQDAFHTEIRTNIVEIKDDLKKIRRDYVPQKWFKNGWKIFNRIVVFLATLLAAVWYWRHR